jgi:NAD dependent epimerase/dehydratase family enzyme
MFFLFSFSWVAIKDIMNIIRFLINDYEMPD